MSDATRRGLRTLVQASTVGALIALAQVFGWIKWTPEQVGAVMALATPLVAFVQNFLEDTGVIPAVGKAPASAGAHPVPEPERLLEPHG